MKSSNRIITTANILTVSRVLILPVIVYYLVIGNRIAAFVFMFLSLLTDTVDGYIARRFHQESQIGKFLDPICDKFSLAVILVTLFLIGSFPLWGLVVIVTRDILILIGSFIIWRTHGKIYMSNLPGRVTGVFFGMMILAFTLNLTIIGYVILYVSVIAVITSFLIYSLRYVRAMKGAK